VLQQGQYIFPAGLVMFRQVFADDLDTEKHPQIFAFQVGPLNISTTNLTNFLVIALQPDGTYRRIGCLPLFYDAEYDSEDIWPLCKCLCAALKTADGLEFVSPASYVRESIATTETWIKGLEKREIWLG
jgi:hypothetical protein